MRIAVIADMHGNAIALETVIADLRAEGVDQVVCLGDAIQGGPQPVETVALLRELACPIVMGNADEWLLTGGESPEPISEQQRAVREWSLARLSAADRAFIAGFQPTVSVNLAAGRRLLCFHGSPSSFDDVILPETPEAEVLRLLGGAGAEFLTGGHTHLQQVRRLGQALFFNPGSVGLVFNHTPPDESMYVEPWAEYAILTTEDDGRVSLALRQIPYDVAAVIRAYETSGRPFVAEAIAQYRSVVS